LAGGIFHGLLSKSLGGLGASGLIGILVKMVNVTLSGAAGLAVFYAVCLLLGAREVKGYVKRFTRL
jgi:hypothetical protein